MEFFVFASFWAGLIGCILRLAIISEGDYPKTKNETLGLDLVRFIVGAILVLWTAFILWWPR